MANKKLFQSSRGPMITATNAINEEMAPAYAFPAKHALAQYAATGCLNQTFYATAKEQIDRVMEYAASVDEEFIAKTAVYCRQRGAMKDMPALLCAILATRDTNLLARIFYRVVDSPRMLRTFVQIIRSGVVGRKSLGTAPKRMICDWLESQSDDAIFRASVGNDPSLRDIIRMMHPKPTTASREALYGYLIGREHDVTKLPESVVTYENFKAGRSTVIPDVPFQMLTSLPLDTHGWCEIAEHGSWQMVRMNLNTFARHGVFAVKGMTQRIASLLRDTNAIAKARAFPYQLLAAYVSAGAQVPGEIRDALQDAMETAIANVPKVDGKVFVCPDVSGSMQSPATGYRPGATTTVRCVDVAALVAAAIVRHNPTAEVIPFEEKVVGVRVNPRDSVMTNAARLAAIGGGGTATSAPLAYLNKRQARGNLVVMVSDNQSWADPPRGRGTEMMREWSRFRHHNPGARMVCIDIQPYGTTQATECEDILNVGGFSDQVFDVIADFASGRLDSDHWVGLIENVKV